MCCLIFPNKKKTFLRQSILNRLAVFSVEKDALDNIMYVEIIYSVTETSASDFLNQFMFYKYDP